MSRKISYGMGAAMVLLGALLSTRSGSAEISLSDIEGLRGGEECFVPIQKSCPGDAGCIAIACIDIFNPICPASSAIRQVSPTYPHYDDGSPGNTELEPLGPFLCAEEESCGGCIGSTMFDPGVCGPSPDGAVPIHKEAFNVGDDEENDC